MLAFDQITSVSDAGITLESGKTYRISLDIYGKQNDASSATKCELMQVQINYARSSTGQPQKPSLAEPVGPDGSVYYQFLGNNAEYIWSFPRGHKSGTLELRAPSNRDIVIESIIIKAFYDRS